jgi:DNA mismatch repair protein MutS2
LEDLVTSFESKTQELDSRLAAAEEEIRQASHERKQFHNRAEKLRREREDIRRQALEEAERIVSSANARVERTIREIREAEAEREATKSARQDLEHYKEDVADQLEDARLRDREDPHTEGEELFVRRNRPASLQSASERGQPGGPISVGDHVVLDEGSSTGEVLEIDGDEAVISLGSMRLRTDTGRIRKVGRKPRQQVSVGRIEHGTGGLSSLSAQSRIDLRGYRVDEAIDAVMRLIDGALAANLDNLEILHGTGTGALRQAIHSYLAERKEVVGFSEAPLNQGGAGVTRVTLS